MLRQFRNTALKTTATGVLLVGALEVTTHIPSEGRSSKLYHTFVDEFATPALRTLLSAEDAHNVAIACTKRGLAPKYRHAKFHNIDMSVSPFPVKGVSKGDDNKTSVPLTFPNPVGLAAGFDKDGVAINGLLEMGFGFVEIGSVTPQPQPGNPKPRMFRLTEDLGVINRYGFNSLGMEAVKQNLSEFRYPSGRDIEKRISTKLWKDMDIIEKTFHVIAYSAQTTVSTFRYLWLTYFGSGYTVGPHGIVGLNVGKNKASENDIEDYKIVIRQLGPLADYIVVNISSPNTPGLRDLQKQAPLKQLLHEVIEERDVLPPRYCGKKRGIVQGKDIPLLVKIAPDLTDSEMKDLAIVVQECGVDGLVISNTTISRPDFLLSKSKTESGGLSGAPLKNLSTQCIRRMYHLTDGKIPIIGVGGVSSGKDVYEKLRAGASLVQVYTALAYEGPGLVSRIQEELSEIMLQNGDKKIDDVVGLDHETLYWNRKYEHNMKVHRAIPILH